MANKVERVRSSGPEAVLIQPRTRGEWREWLAKNHAVSKGIWVVLIKKGSGLKGITYEAAVEEALCYGWIDTRPNTVDEGRYKLHLTPRRAGSIWSKGNKARMRRLMKQDLVASPGLAKMQAAKKDGSWARMDAIDRLEMPADLLVALSGNERAREHFAAFSASAKKVILFWIAMPNGQKPDRTGSRKPFALRPTISRPVTDRRESANERNGHTRLASSRCRLGLLPSSALRPDQALLGQSRRSLF